MAAQRPHLQSNGSESPAMKSRRTALVGLTVATLLSVSGTALASSPQPGAQSAAVSSSAQLLGSARHATAVHPTNIRFLMFDHMLPPGGTVHIRGQVAGKAQGTRGALAGVVVRLYRHFDPTKPWIYLGTQTTGAGQYPQFNFSTIARMNATYKVVFAGNDTFLPSEDTTWLSVYRMFNGVIRDGKSAATLHGNVNPYYTHKVIYLQKRACAPCGYVTVKKATTGMAGAYSFTLPAPPSGRWWWRVTVPGSGGYIESRSGTFSTQQI
jgi:hypothetical protein